MPPVRSKIFSPFCLLFFTTLFLSSETIAAPAKTPPQDSGAQKTIQHNSAENSVKSGDGAHSAPESSNADSARTAGSEESKTVAPVKTGESAVSEVNKTADKIIATVNGSNITQSDYERILFARGVNTNSRAITAQTIDEALDVLINEILARDYVAKQGRLNDPLLEKRIAHLRFQAILEYFNYMVAANLKPITESDLQTFIDEHPDYFKDRRYFYFTSVEFIKNKDIDINQIRTMLNSSDSFDKITFNLDSKKIPFALFRGFRPSEQINPNVFAKLKTMTPGESAVVTDPETDQVFIFKLFSSSPDPVQADKNREQLRMALIMSNASRASRELIEQMRSSADIKIIDKPKPTVTVQTGKFAATNARVTATSSSLFKKYDPRNKLEKSGPDFGMDIANTTLQNKNNVGNQLVMALIRNIWIMSLLLIVPATFYNFVNASNKIYANLVLEGSQGFNRELRSSYKLQKILLDPMITWIIGIVLILLISYIAWDGFNEKNLDILFLSNTYIAISVISALLLSALLIFTTSKIYQRLPDYIKNFRLMFFGIILITNIVILKIL